MPNVVREMLERSRRCIRLFPVRQRRRVAIDQPMKLTVTTHIPSPYQVELFDALVRSKEVELNVIYSERVGAGRSWGSPKLSHQSAFLNGDTDHSIVRRWVLESDLLVCGWYGDARMRALFSERSQADSQSVLWGERPQQRWPVLSRFRRRLLLRSLLSSSLPIWGIGSWAVEGWKAEFGKDRPYFNVPYYSDLGRFGSPERTFGETRTIIFSGSLIARKGIDLLANSFAKLAPEYPLLRLVILGTGPMEKELRMTLKNVADRVAFRGFVDWSALPTEYRSGDMLFAPSRYDGWGLIVPEGLASGLPVLATHKMGAALDLIHENVNGWIIDADDQAAVTDAVRRCATISTPVLRQFSAAASESVKNHSLDCGVECFLNAAKQSCR